MPTLSERKTRGEARGHVLNDTLENTCTTAVEEICALAITIVAPDGAVYVVNGREDAVTLSTLILRFGDSRLIAGSPNKKSFINESANRYLTLLAARVMTPVKSLAWAGVGRRVPIAATKAFAHLVLMVLPIIETPSASREEKPCLIVSIEVPGETAAMACTEAITLSVVMTLTPILPAMAPMRFVRNCPDKPSALLCCRRRRLDHPERRRRLDCWFIPDATAVTIDVVSSAFDCFFASSRLESALLYTVFGSADGAEACVFTVSCTLISEHAFIPSHVDTVTQAKFALSAIPAGTTKLCVLENEGPRSKVLFSVVALPHPEAEKEKSNAVLWSSVHPVHVMVYFVSTAYPVVGCALQAPGEGGLFT
jgi:hypothetical protein